MVNKLLTVLALIFGISNGDLLNRYVQDLNSPSIFISKIEESILGRGFNISLGCASHLNRYIWALREGETWAMKMLDSVGKIPTGILEGNMVDLGNFDECLNAEGSFSNSKIINAKYCIGTIPMETIQQYIINPQQTDFKALDVVNSQQRILTSYHPKLGVHLATCLPAACTASDIQEMYTNIFKPITANMTFEEKLCQTKASQAKLDSGSIATLSFLGVVLGIMIISTVYDTTVYYLERKPAHSLLIAFSVFTNGRKIITTSNNPGQINCLHGIRVISTMWVILGHRYVFQFQFPLRNHFHLIDFMNNAGNMFIVGASVVVDTFFFISGLVLVYVYMSGIEKGVKFNIISFYLHRYLRLTPVVAVIVLIYATLLRQMGSGPLWPTTVEPKLITSCEQNWWKALLYIQNFDQPEDMCLPHSWYLSVDMQLFFLSPLLLIPLKSWSKLTLIATGILAFCSTAAGFLTALILKLGRNLEVILDQDRNRQNMKYVYLATWTRASPWLIGFILGYFIFRIKQRQTKFVINKVTLLVLWIVAIGVLCTCLFAGHDAYVGEFNNLEAACNSALIRPAWAIAVGWVIFACVTGNGGPVDWFLSSPLFQVLSKLTFTMYMVHYAIVYAIIAQMRNPPIFSNAHQMYVFWGDFACTTVVALMFTLAFESPLITVENFLLGEKRIQKPIVTQTETKGRAIA